MAAPLITNVSDTARWVAAYRAAETARADRLFDDPLAQKLAGVRGYAIAEQAPVNMGKGWPIVMRTKVIDDLVGQSVAAGTDLIVNLAAGFDTRPYRLALPPSLRWVEADLPDMVAEKEAPLSDLIPRCHLTRIGIDLSNAAARVDLFQQLGEAARRVLVITEGLLVYLDPENVSDFTRDLAGMPHLAEWVADLTSPWVVQRLTKSFKGGLAQAPMKFAPADGVAFFERRGWRALDIVSLFHEAVRHRRVPALLRLAARITPRPNPRQPRGPWAAVVRFSPSKA